MMSTTTQTKVMNEEAFAKLAAFPHVTNTLKNTNVYKWNFLDEQDNLMILEFKCGWITLRTSFQYIEELFVYNAERNGTFTRLGSIDEWLESNMCYLEKTQKIHNSTTEVVNKLLNPSALGQNTCFAANEYGWVVKAPKMHASIFINTYKDPNQKTIKLEYKDIVSNKTKTGLVDKKQLYAFLKKNLSILKEEPVPDTAEVNKVAKKLEETHIETPTSNKPAVSSVPYHLMSKEEKAKLRVNSKLFIPVPKEKRIAYQTCKPIRGNSTTCWTQLISK